MTAKQIRALRDQAPKTDEELNLLIADTIAAQTTMEETIARRDQKAADALASLETKYGFGATIAENEIALDENLVKLEAWCDANRKTRFGEVKSIEVAGAKIGWRLDGWKTELLGKMKWADVVAFLQSIARAPAKTAAAKLYKECAERFLRTKIEPDKEAMIAARGNADEMELLTCAGVAVVIEESFYFKRAGDGQSESTLRAA